MTQPTTCPVLFSELIAQSVHGWLTIDEFCALADFASNVEQSHHIVEIGAFRGLSTLALAYGSKKGQRAKVYSVDPHDYAVQTNQCAYGPEDMAEWYSTVVRFKLGDIVYAVKLSSMRAARAWDDHSIDLCFLDGAHDEFNVRADIDAWYPKVRPGGVMLFHDYNINTDPGVVAALVHRPSGLSYAGNIDAIGVFYKDDNQR